MWNWTNSSTKSVCRYRINTPTWSTTACATIWFKTENIRKNREYSAHERTAIDRIYLPFVDLSAHSLSFPANRKRHRRDDVELTIEFCALITMNGPKRKNSIQMNMVYSTRKSMATKWYEFVWATAHVLSHSHSICSRASHRSIGWLPSANRLLQFFLHFLPCFCGEQDLPYIDCMATGWGKSSTSSEQLSDKLVKTKVIIYDNARCQAVYGEHVSIHDGHLCGGTLHGKGGTCIGL